MIVPADSNFAFNVLVEVGKLRFNENRQVAEIQLILLQKHAIKISTSEVEVLINNFLFYLTAVHQQNMISLPNISKNRAVIFCT